MTTKAASAMSPKRALGDWRNMATDRTIEQLNHLIEVNKDAEFSLKTAAENVENTEIQSLFAKYAAQQWRFSVELQSDIERLGANPSDSGTRGGAVQRGWME